MRQRRIDSRRTWWTFNSIAWLAHRLDISLQLVFFSGMQKLLRENNISDSKNSNYSVFFTPEGFHIRLHHCLWWTLRPETFYSGTQKDKIFYNSTHASMKLSLLISIDFLGFLLMVMRWCQFCFDPENPKSTESLHLLSCIHLHWNVAEL